MLMRINDMAPIGNAGSSSRRAVDTYQQPLASIKAGSPFFEQKISSSLLRQPASSAGEITMGREVLIRINTSAPHTYPRKRECEIA